MKRYHGGTTVEGGYYWDLANWEINTVQGDVGTLQGPASANFLRLPLPLLILVTPLMGALYAFFLPALGFVMVAWALAKKLAEIGHGAMNEMAATVSPAWRPGEAHFAGKPGEAKKAEEKKVSPSLERLQKEIEQRRSEEEKRS